MYVECPFCHQMVPKLEYARHEAQHTRLLPDGQMADHVTVRPNEQYQGSIGDVPQTYQHARCGGMTIMPEEIIRSYLADPFLYNDQSFCTGCNKYVSMRELYWLETGESLFDYQQQLRRDYIAQNRIPPQRVRRAADGSITGIRRPMGFIGWTVALVVVPLVLLSGASAAGIAFLRARPAPAARPVQPAMPFAAPAFAPPGNLNEAPGGPFPGHNPGAHLEEMRRSHEEMRARHDAMHREMQDRIDERRRRPGGF